MDTPHTELSKPNMLAREPAAPMVLQLGQTSGTAQQTVSMSVIWQCLLHRLTLAVPLGVVLAVIAGNSLYFFTEQKFRSSSRLRIIEKQQFLAFPTQELSTDFGQTQIELLKDPSIIRRAIDNENLAQQLPELREVNGKEDPVVWIGQRLKAVRIGKSELYEVSFTTRIPQSAKTVVDAIVETYIDYHASQSNDRRVWMLEKLKDAVDNHDKKIEQARTRLRERAKMSGGGDDGVVMDMQGIGGGATRAVGRFAQMSNLQQKLIDAEIEIEIAKAEVEALTSEITRAQEESAADDATEGSQTVLIPESQIEARIERDSAIVALRKDLKQNQETLSRLNKDSPNFARVQKEIDTLKNGLDEKKLELKPAIIAEVEQQLASDRRDALTAAQANLKKRQQTKKLLVARIETEKGEQSEHGDQSLELQFARDELAKVEDVRRHIADRSVQLQTESGAPDQVYRIAKATLPEFPDGPTIVKKVAMASAAAFFAPFLLLVGWDLAHRRIFEREQLERELDVKAVKFVCEVAALPTRAWIRKPGADRDFQLQSHLFEESINSLRATLSIDARLEDKQVFVFASAVSGEGKSNLSAQLAMSWSQATRGRVLIVDSDLRSPSIHELFEVRSHPGLAEVLEDQCSVEDATVMHWGDHLFVLPAGNSRSSSPSHLFSGPRFRAVLAELRQHFDKIIIDVPPVLCASEALLIAKEADAVLMCALHDFSRSGQVKHAYERLVGGGVNVVGAVLNGTPVRKYSSTYRGYAPA